MVEAARSRHEDRDLESELCPASQNRDLKNALQCKYFNTLYVDTSSGWRTDCLNEDATDVMDCASLCSV